ncbi:MAG: hypothetical protein Q8P26_05160 [Candidatus Levybacteria bacterium]|nr:hypothetical protein [Candidatus Levybacteria bacterium]
MDDKTKKLIEKAQIKDTLQQEFQLTLDQRVDRYFEVRPHGIIPSTHFAAVSAESHLLFRDGYYYGTISLVQAVSEALVKFLCKRNGWKPNKDFEENIRQLKTRGKVTDDLLSLFTKIWNGRDDYHHLNPQIEQDRQKLEILAKEKLTDLKNIEKELFAYTTKEGKLVPKYPKYWDQKDNTVPVFLRLD